MIKAHLGKTDLLSIRAWVLEKAPLFFNLLLVILVLVGYPVLGVAWMSNRPPANDSTVVVAAQEIPAFSCIRIENLKEENHPLESRDQAFSQVDQLVGKFALNRIMPDKPIHRNEVLAVENCENYRLLFISGQSKSNLGHSPGSHLNLLGFEENASASKEIFSAILVVESTDGYLIAIPQDKVSEFIKYLSPPNRLIPIWEVK